MRRWILSLMLAVVAMSSAGPVHAQEAVATDEFSPSHMGQFGDELELSYWEFDEAFWSLTEPHGGQGGGASLEVLVRVAIGKAQLDLPDLYYDSESDAFHVRGSRASLLVVAGIIRLIMTDKVYAESLIVEAEAMGIFE